MSDADSPVELIILGMHRSGTSSVAGYFQQAGWFFGPDHQSFDLHATNQKGFFERRDVVCLNDRLLDSYGASWITPERFPRNPDSPVDFLRHPEHTLAVSMLDAMRSHGPYFLKDPRMCVTLPFWLPLFRRPFFLLVVRHPLNVARSLAARRDCGLAAGFALWERYTRDMFRFTKGKPRAVVHFEQIMADPANVMAAIHQQIDVATGGPLPDPAKHVAANWFEAGLVHHSASDQALRACAPEPVAHLYRDLVSTGEQAASLNEPLSSGSRHALAELEEEVVLRQHTPSHAAMWHARHAAFAHAEYAAARQRHHELLALLQSWRWKVPHKLATWIGARASRDRQGFDPVAMCRDAEDTIARMARESNLLATARRQRPIIQLPHEPQRTPSTAPHSVLLVSTAGSPSLAASWLIAFTTLIATRGHTVDWLTRHDMARVIDDTDLPVFSHTWLDATGVPYGTEILEPLLARYDLVILDGAYDDVWHPPLQEALRRANRVESNRVFSLELAEDAAPCRLPIPSRANPRFDLAIIINTASGTSDLATAIAAGLPGTQNRIALLCFDHPLPANWQQHADRSGWTTYDQRGNWTENLSILGDSNRCLAIRPIDLAWPTAAGRPGYLWTDETPDTWTSILSGNHDTSAMRFDQHALRVTALRRAEERVLDALNVVPPRHSS